MHNIMAKTKKSILKKIQEAHDVSLYQKLLKVLGTYSAAVPATGVDNLFNVVAEHGKKVLPKDKKALEILGYVLSCGTPARVVHKLLNWRFSDLPVEHRPMMKNGRKHLVASWSRDTEISDKIKDLIDFDLSGTAGRWTDIEGDKVSLIPLKKEEK